MNRKTKKISFAAVLSLVLFGALQFFVPHQSNSWAKGKWMNVYAGSDTPRFQECVSSLATRCVTGDIRTLPEPPSITDDDGGN